MRSSHVNFLVKIQIRCWDINKTRQGITFICRTLYTTHTLQTYTCNCMTSIILTRSQLSYYCLDPCLSHAVCMSVLCFFVSLLSNYVTVKARMCGMFSVIFLPSFSLLCICFIRFNFSLQWGLESALGSSVCTTRTGRQARFSALRDTGKTFRSTVQRVFSSFHF